jgi:hypothetical protein
MVMLRCRRQDDELSSLLLSMHGAQQAKGESGTRKERSGVTCTHKNQARPSSNIGNLLVQLKLQLQLQLKLKLVLDGTFWSKDPERRFRSDVSAHARAFSHALGTDRVLLDGRRNAHTTMTF